MIIQINLCDDAGNAVRHCGLKVDAGHENAFMQVTPEMVERYLRPAIQQLFHEELFRSVILEAAKVGLNLHKARA